WPRRRRSPGPQKRGGEGDRPPVGLRQGGDPTVTISRDRQRAVVSIALLDEQIQPRDGLSPPTADPAGTESPRRTGCKTQRLIAVVRLADGRSAEPWVASIDEPAVRLADELVACIAWHHEASKRRIDVEQCDVDRESPALAKEELEAGDPTEGIEGVVAAIHDRGDAARLHEVDRVDQVLSDRKVHRVSVFWCAFVRRRLGVLVLDEARQPANAAKSRDADTGVGRDRLAVGAHRAGPGQPPLGYYTGEWGCVVVPELRFGARVETEIIRQCHRQWRRGHAAHGCAEEELEQRARSPRWRRDGQAIERD